MKTTRCLTLLTTALLACTLTACSLQQFVAGMIPDGDLVLVQALFKDVRAGDMAAAQTHFDAQDVPSTAQLQTLHDLLATSHKPELTSADINKQSSSPWQTTLIYQLGHGEQARMVMLNITGQTRHRYFDAMQITQSFDMDAIWDIAKPILIDFAALLAVVIGFIVWLFRHRKRARAR